MQSCVGLSNILYKELIRRTPGKRSHGKVVGASVVDSELVNEVAERIKSVAGIKTLLVFPVAALHLAVVSGSVGTDELVADAEFSCSDLKQSRQISFAVGKAIGEFKAVVGLDAFHPYASAGIPFDQPFEEIGGRIGGLLLVSRQKAQSGKLVDGSVLEQPQLRIRDTFAWNDLHIYLNALARVSHLYVGLWLIGVFLLFLGEQA